jgi:hypothetical protein
MSTAKELRGYLGRLLGWANTGAIEHALRSIDLAREHRAQLVLCGQGDLVPLAYGLHRRAFGIDAPFIVCDPRRGDTPATVRSPANLANAAAAFEAAAGGSLCIRRRRPPHDFSSLVTRLRSSNDVKYICLEEDSLQWLVRPGPIEIPNVAERLSELPRTSTSTSSMRSLRLRPREPLPSTTTTGTGSSSAQPRRRSPRSRKLQRASSRYGAPRTCRKPPPGSAWLGGTRRLSPTSYSTSAD